jgi:GNAT superfamily N-acetyltransferase
VTAAAPPGLRAASLSAADVGAVTSVWRACEEHDDGQAECTEADVVAFLGRPSFDFARDTVGVRDGEALVAFGVQLGVRITFVHVLPAYRGRGVGAWLLRWSQDAARMLGAELTAQEISDNNSAAITLLESDGYARRWDSWAMEITLEREPPAPALPPGYAIRDFVPGRDDRVAFDVIDRAFSEWPEQAPHTFDDWAAASLRRPGFAPPLLGLAERDREVVGAVLLIEDEREGWIDQLAVAREHRGRGLARALLMHAFGMTWRRGGRRCGLGTDARTGARGLYEHVGMRVRKTYGEYAKPL